MIVFLKDNLFIMYCLIFGENTYQFRQLSIFFYLHCYTLKILLLEVEVNDNEG